MIGLLPVSFFQSHCLVLKGLHDSGLYTHASGQYNETTCTNAEVSQKETHNIDRERQRDRSDFLYKDQMIPQRAAIYIWTKIAKIHIRRTKSNYIIYTYLNLCHFYMHIITV